MDTCFRKNTQIDRVNKAYVLKIAKKNFSVCQTILMRQQTNPEVCFYKLFYLILSSYVKTFCSICKCTCFPPQFWDFWRRYSLALDTCRCFSFFIVELTSPKRFSVAWIVTDILSNLLHNKVAKTRLKLKLFAFLAVFRCFLSQVLTR